MKLQNLLQTLHPDKLFRLIPDDFFQEFEEVTRLRNVSSVWGIAGVCLFFLVITLSLDLLRWQTGIMAERQIYRWLFLSHLLFLFQLFPLYYLSRNWTKVKNGTYPHTRRIISSSVVLASLTLLCMTILTMAERGSVILYGVHIILINFLVLFPHRWRIRFNGISLLIILVAVLWIYRSDQHDLAVAIVEVVGITIPGFLVSTYRYNETIRLFLIDQRIKEQKKIISEEREKSDQLLLNILPAAIAAELKENGKVLPRHHEQVVILFSDFKGYTALSKTMSADDLVKELDACFGAFDLIVAEQGLEKIKTLGDGYFCVGGIDEDGDAAVFSMLTAAQAMLRFMAERKAVHQVKGLPAFDIRIGLHCGPVVAGVVGKSKFTYDIWGSTVNIASRMETAGEVGRINVSEAIYRVVHPQVPCTYRGELEAKGLGKTKMYFVV